MMKALKALIGAAQRTDATADELAVLVRDADAELQTARTAFTEAQQAYQDGLLNPDDAYLQKLDDACTKARIRRDRAEAIVTALAERHAVAIEREAQTVKIARHAAAARRAAEMREVLLEMYPAAAQAVVDIIRALAETEIEVEAANKDLPAGVEPIPGVEVSVRNRPGTLPQLLSEQEVTRWCHAGDARPDAIAQDLVEVTKDDRGLLRHSRGGVEHLVKRTFVERRYSAFDPGNAPDRLAISVNLPGIQADERPFFSPLDRRGVADPHAVLKVLDRPVVVSPATPAERVEWVLVGTVDAENERRRPSTLAGLLSEQA